MKAIRFTINGVSKTIKEWPKHTGLSESLIRGRIQRGWTSGDIIKPKILSSADIGNRRHRTDGHPWRD